jgi:hypothetical protein
MHYKNGLILTMKQMKMGRMEEGIKFVNSVQKCKIPVRYCSTDSTKCCS